MKLHTELGRLWLDETKTNDRVSNLERFLNFAHSEDIDIIFVNETWLSVSIDNGETLHSGYTVVRNDRDGRTTFYWELKRGYLNLRAKLSMITIWRLFWLN